MSSPGPSGLSGRVSALPLAGACPARRPPSRLPSFGSSPRPRPPLPAGRSRVVSGAVRRRKTGGGGGGELLELPESSSPSGPRRRRKPIDLAEIFREQRVLFVGRPIDGPLAAELVSLLLLHEAAAPDRPVTIVLACPGGELGPALALRDAARHARCPVGTLALGACSGAAALLLATAASGAGGGAAGRWGEAPEATGASRGGAPGATDAAGASRGGAPEATDAAGASRGDAPEATGATGASRGDAPEATGATGNALALASPDGESSPSASSSSASPEAKGASSSAPVDPARQSPSASAPPRRSPTGRRRALPHAVVSLRGPWGRTRGRATELAARAAALARSDERIAGMFAEATGRAADDVRADMDAGRAFDAESALAYGLIDEIVLPGGGVKDGAGGDTGAPREAQERRTRR